jgi:hypothetical protein
MKTWKTNKQTKHCFSTYCFLLEITISNYPQADDISIAALTKDNDDVLDVEAQHHDKINTDYTHLDDQKEGIWQFK